jgi:predicted regulator of Ras-like GTPase activity (Roadblock/LC7/MglB family)
LLAECLERARLCRFTGKLCLRNNRLGRAVDIPFNGGEPNIKSLKEHRDIIDEIGEWGCEEIHCAWYNSNNKEVIMAISEEHLAPLSKIDGFRGAVVYTASGDLLVHHIKTKMALPPEGIAAFGAELSKFSRKVSDDMRIGAAEFCRIETPEAVVIHRCVEPGAVGMSVIADQNANAGMIVYTMNKIIEKVRAEGL